MNCNSDRKTVTMTEINGRKPKSSHMNGTRDAARLQRTVEVQLGRAEPSFSKSSRRVYATLNYEWPSCALINSGSWAAGKSERESSPAMAIGLQVAATEDMDVLLDENFMCFALEPSPVRRTTQTRATTKGVVSRNRSSPIRIPTRNMRSTRAVEFRYGGDNGGGEFDDEEEEGEGMVPPHVIVDRRMNGRKTASSVCTGNGRTLKGRDLRRVRNLVLTQTGFLEGRLVL